jgi:hypothetical protein
MPDGCGWGGEPGFPRRYKKMIGSNASKHQHQNMNGTESTNKRKHKHAAATSVSPNQCVVAVCESMQSFVGGRRLCKLSEITLTMFGNHALSAGVLVPCAEIVQVSVRDPQGKTTVIDMASGSSVGALKGRLAEETGTPQGQQRLFDPDGTNATEPLDNTHVLHTSCTLVLVVDETPFSWDTESVLFSALLSSLRSSQSESRMDLGTFANNPPYNLLADGKVVRTTGDMLPSLNKYNHNNDHALLIIPRMVSNAGDVYTVSFRVTPPPHGSDVLWVDCGLVRVGHADNRCIGEKGGWCFRPRFGGTWYLSSIISEFNVIDVENLPFGGALVCMTLDCANGTLTFAVDGVPCEKGFVDIPTNTALQWAVSTRNCGTVIEIVPN